MSMLLEWEAAEQIGEKILEIVDRLKDVDAAIPGAEARWVFEVDDMEVECVMRIVSRHPTTPKADT